jgi:hypothetical protein
MKEIEMNRSRHLTIWAVVVCACLAATPGGAIAKAAVNPAKPKHGKSTAGRLDPSFGNHGHVIVSISPAWDSIRGDES